MLNSEFIAVFLTAGSGILGTSISGVFSRVFSGISSGIASIFGSGSLALGASEDLDLRSGASIKNFFFYQQPHLL